MICICRYKIYFLHMIYQKNIPVIHKKALAGNLEVRMEENALNRTKQWKLDHYKFNRLRKEFIQSIEQLDIQSLELNHNSSKQKSPLIQKIIHIKFPNLKLLDLHNNQILSIESIQLLNVSCLQKLRLDDNFITFLQPLRKMKLPSLKILEIDRNRITQLNCFSELQAQNLTHVFIQYPNHTLWENMQDSSAQWVFKMESRNISKLALHNQYRIKNSKLQFQFQNKFTKLEDDVRLI